MESICRKVTFREAKELMSRLKNWLLLDVREEEEYITGHADGAVLFPVDSISEQTASELIPDKETPVFLYCKTGARAELAAETLAGLGYRQIYNIGSLSGWPYGLSFD